MMNNNTLKNTISQAVANCTNNISVDELETVNLSDKLNQKKEEVKQLESLIAECEDCKAKTEAEEKAKQEAQESAKAKAEEIFFGTLTASGKEVMAYLEGLKTLAKDEQLTLVGNIEKIFKGYSKGDELTATANLAAYVAILVKEEQREVINLLESITLKIDAIQCAASVNEERVAGLLNILLAVQDIY